MNKKEIKSKVNELLAAGVAKADVFARLSGQGVKGNRLAYYIASHASHRLCDQYAGKVNILITLMFVQALLGFFMGFVIGAKLGPNAQWVAGAFVASIPLLFAWGFYKNYAGAYNAYILLSIVQLPKQFSGFSDNPIATSIGLAVGIGILIFVWYLQQKIFPDFAFIAPKKIKGQYVFSEQSGAQAREMPTELAKPVSPPASNENVTSKSSSSEKTKKPQVRWKVVLSIVALAVLGGASFLVLPSNAQYALQDAIKRPFAPNFDLPPNQMKSARQDDWITEYRNRGYDLHCYGNLQPEEQASKDDDYNCWGIIKSAYDNIPARMIVFWFHKGELQHIKIELPESSFAQLQDFLGRHFDGVKRLDQSPDSQFGVDVYGKRLMVWPTKHGIVVASNAPTSGQPLTLLWTSKEKLARDVVVGLFSRATASATPLSVPGAASTVTPLATSAPGETATAGPISTATISFGPNRVPVTIKEPAPNITNIETQGNLESTNNVGCVGPDKLNRKFTSADLYRAAATCAQQGMNREGAFLAALAGAYGYFDTLRVADKSAHGAPIMLRMTVLDSLGERKGIAFQASIKTIYSDPDAHAEICKGIIRIGSPDYFPRYMIQHGIKVLTDANAGNGLVEGFDANTAWSQTLGKYLHCAGYEVQQPSTKNNPDAAPAQTQPPLAHNTVMADAKAMKPKRRKPSDLRYCLDLPSRYAIAKCVEQ